MLINDIGEELFLELDKPSDISISSISYYLKINLGSLNNSLDTNFTIDDAQTLDPTPSESVKVIFKKQYLVYYYGKKSLSNLGAAALDSVIDISSDGARVRRVSKNDVSKSFNLLKQSAQRELNDLVNAYRLGQIDPLAIVGPEENREELIGGKTLARI